MASPTQGEEDHAKEVVRDEIRDSIAPEVDGRGIEVVVSEPASEQRPQLSFWKRYRYAIAAAVSICIVGAVVGGAVGGTVGKHHEEAPKSRYELLYFSATPVLFEFLRVFPLWI